MTSSKNEFDYIELFKVLEAQKASKDLNEFYKRKDVKHSEVITRLIHRLTLSVQTIPKEFNNCAGNFSNYKGNRIIAIIGEKPAGPSPLAKSYPFLEVTGSSGWLNSQLNDTHAREDRLFWANALNLDDSENDPEIINQLMPKQIVCLGKIAERWAKKNGWEFVSFPHPQYWKRFKSKQPYPLIDFLRNASAKS